MGRQLSGADRPAAPLAAAESSTSGHAPQKKNNRGRSVFDEVNHALGTLEKLYGIEFNEDAPVSVEFRGENLVLRDLASAPLEVMCTVIWELHELLFMHDLRSLAEMISLSQGNTPRSPLDFWEDVIDMNAVSVASSTAATFESRVAWAKAMGRIMAFWPDAPRELRRSPGKLSEEQLEHLEEVVSKLFVQTFWKWNERPPIVPHRLPIIIP